MRCRSHLFFSLIIAISILSGCSKQSERKIQLSDTASNQKTRIQTASSVLQVTPEQQHSIAIFSFQNNTGDPSLDWLSRGLADMLATELSQSLYINVVPMNRLYESLKQIGKKAEDLNNQSIALEVAKQTQAENILTGSFYQEDESLKIYVMLWDVETEQVLRKDFVQGPGLERIFAMVDELSTRLRTNLRGDLEASPVAKLPLAAMTQSIEAFRCYSKALANMDQLFYAEADTCLRQAIEIDSTFAAAYLLQSRVKALSGDNKAANYALRQARRYADKLSESDRIWLRFIEAQLAGDISKILTAMQELLQYEPNDIETRMQLGSLLLKLQDYDRALAEYELIMELDPKRKLVYNQLGYVHAHRGEFNTALKYLDKYADLAPDEPNPYDSKGEVLMMAGRLQEAAKQYEIALAKRPDFGNAALQLSNLYGELGDLNRALKYSDHWIAEQSNELWLAEAYVKRALLHWRFGQITKAKEALKMAQKKWPNLISVGLIGGEMYKAIGDTSAALQLYKSYFDRYKKMAVHKEQDFYEIQRMLRFCMEADLPPAELIQIVEPLAERESNPLQRKMIRGHLGLLYLRMGEYEKAKPYLREQNTELMELLTKLPNPGRSSAWKYSIEAIRLEPIQEAADYQYCNQMLEIARNAGRKDLEVLARFFRAQYHAKYGAKQKLASEYQDLGVPLEDNWRVIGPFENHSGFDYRFPPEDSIDLSAAYQSAGRSLKWRSINDGAYDGFVDFGKTLQPSSWAVGYAVVYINSPEKRKVQLRVASDESCKLWLNDKLVWQIYRKEDVPLDHDIISVVLHTGNNKLLIKVTNSVNDWGFYFRVTDEAGDGFQDIKFNPVGKEFTTFANR